MNLYNFQICLTIFIASSIDNASTDVFSDLSPYSSYREGLRFQGISVSPDLCYVKRPCFSVTVPTDIPDGCSEMTMVRYVRLAGWGNPMTNDIPCEFKLNQDEYDDYYKEVYIIRSNDVRAGETMKWKGCSRETARFEHGEWILVSIQIIRDYCTEPDQNQVIVRSFLIRLPFHNATKKELGKETEFISAEVSTLAEHKLAIKVTRNDISNPESMCMDWEMVKVKIAIKKNGVVLDEQSYYFTSATFTEPGPGRNETMHTFESDHIDYVIGNYYMLCWSFNLIEIDSDRERFKMGHTRVLRDFENLTTEVKCKTFKMEPPDEKQSNETASTDTASTETVATESSSNVTASTESKSTDTTSTKNAATNMASTNTASTERTSTDTATIEKATETASTDAALTDSASTKTPPTGTVSTERAATKTASTEKASTERASTDTASTEATSTERACVSIKTASTQSASTGTTSTETAATDTANCIN